MSRLTIKYAESDDEVIAIHGFLAVVMGPLLPFPIDAQNSAMGVWRVVNHECALIAIHDGRIVATIGLVKAPFWWAKDRYFFANKWLAALPGSGALGPLLREAVAVAKALASPEQPNGLELHLYDEARGRLTILNRNPRRRDANPLLARANAAASYYVIQEMKNVR